MVVEGSDWENAYAEYIKSTKVETEIGIGIETMYHLLYIGEDAIPELYINYGYSAAGEICTFVDGEISLLSTNT